MTAGGAQLRATLGIAQQRNDGVRELTRLVR